MAGTVVIVEQTGQVVTVPTPTSTSVVVTGQGPQGPASPSFPGDVPVYIQNTAPTGAPVKYVWYDTSTTPPTVWVEDGT